MTIFVNGDCCGQPVDEQRSHSLAFTPALQTAWKHTKQVNYVSSHWCDALPWVWLTHSPAGMTIFEYGDRAKGRVPSGRRATLAFTPALQTAWKHKKQVNYVSSHWCVALPWVWLAHSPAGIWRSSYSYGNCCGPWVQCGRRVMFAFIRNFPPALQTAWKCTFQL